MVKLFNEEKTDTVLYIIMKVTNNMVEAPSFTLDLFMAISMMILAIFGLNTIPYRGQKLGTHWICFGFSFFFIKCVKSYHIVRPCNTILFEKDKIL